MARTLFATVLLALMVNAQAIIYGVVRPGFVAPRRVTVIRGHRHLLAENNPASTCTTLEQLVYNKPEWSGLRSLADGLSRSMKDEILRDAGSDFTFFAPTNGAVTNLESALDKAEPNGAKMLASNSTAIDAVLRYHFVPGREIKNAENLRQGAQLKTLLNEAPPLMVRREGQNEYIDAVGSEAKVAGEAIPVCGGSVIPVDEVLLPMRGQ